MPERGAERFPKSLRLRARREFVRVQSEGRKVAEGPLLALALGNATETTRLGITVSKKVGNAVVRVRIRRRLREVFRRRKDELPRGIDVVLIARASAKDADYDELSRAFEAVTSRLKRQFS